MKIWPFINKRLQLLTVLSPIICLVFIQVSTVVWGNQLNKTSEWPFTETLLYIKGGVNALAEGSNLLFWAVGDTITVIDKNSFTRISDFRVNTASTVEDMVYNPSNTTLFIAAGFDKKNNSGGLQIFSLAVPSNPVMVGACYKSTLYPGSVKTDDLGGSKPVSDIDARGVGLNGNTLFLADNNYGLRVFDISVPSSPYEIPLTIQDDNRKSGYKQPDINGDYLTTGGYIGLSVYPHDDRVYAFVLDYYQGVDVFDVTNPAVIDDPFIKDTRTIFWFGSCSLLSDIFITETGGRLSAYVGGTNFDDSEHFISRLDISLNNLNNNNSIINYGYCSLSDNVRGITAKENYAYVAADNSGLQIVDISDVPSVSGDVIKYPVVGTYTSHVNFSYSVLLDGTSLYLASGETGLNKLDVSTVSAPVYQSSIESTLSADNVCVSSDMNYTYMLDRKKGLRVFDTSVPEYPILRSFLGNTTPESQATAFCVSGSYVFIAYTTGKIKIANVSDPDASVFTNTIITATDPKSLAIMGNNLYIADGSDKSLRVVTIADPYNPSIIGTVKTLGNALSVTVSGNKAYVSEGENGVEIFDITDPVHPLYLANFATNNAQATAVCNSDHNIYLFVADGSSGLKIQDVTNPASLSSPITFNNMGEPDSPIPFNAVSVTVLENNAFIGMGHDGVLALDISTPSSPSIISRYVTPSSSSDVSAYNLYNSIMETKYTYLAVADGTAGFKLFYLFNGDVVDTTPLTSYDNTGCFIDSIIPDHFSTDSATFFGIYIVYLHSPVPTSSNAGEIKL